jgi:hypothetical protein
LILDFHNLCEIAVEHIITISISDSTSESYIQKLRNEFPSKVKICVQIAKSAMENNINPLLAVSIGLHETEFQSLVSMPCSKRKAQTLKRTPKAHELNSCAQGPLQAIPHYFCPNKSSAECDLVSAGIQAITRMAHTISPTHGVLDPYDISYCVSHEAECGTLLAKYNRGLKGEFKKGRREYSNYAIPILSIYEFIYYRLEDAPTC